MKDNRCRQLRIAEDSGLGLSQHHLRSRKRTGLCRMMSTFQLITVGAVEREQAVVRDEHIIAIGVAGLV